MSEKTNNNRFVIWGLVFAFFIRGGVLFYHLDTFNDDPDNYVYLADNLREYQIFGYENNPTAFRPPLYPILLSFVLSLQTNENNSSSVSHWLLSRNASIALFHWILGILTVFLAYRIALECRLSKEFAVLAAFLVAVDPVLLQQSRLVMTETLATFLAAFLVWGLIKIGSKNNWNRKCITKNFDCSLKNRLAFSLYSFKLLLKYLGIGLLLGLATLCRPTFFVFALLIFLVFLLKWTKYYFSIEIRRFCCSFLSFGVALLIGFAVPLIPWGIRNESVFGQHQFIITTTHAGYTLLLANNDFIYDYYQNQWPWESVWDPNDFHFWWAQKLQELSEKEQNTEKQTQNNKGVENQNLIDKAFENKAELNPDFPELSQNQWAKNKAIETIKNRPEIFFWSILVRIGNFWQFLPYCVTNPFMESFQVKFIRYCIGFYYFFELGLAFLGCVFLWPGKNRSITFFSNCWIWGGLLILSTQIPHLFFWTNMRMRSPLMFFVPILAVYGVCRLLDYQKTKKTISKK